MLISLLFGRARVRGVYNDDDDVIINPKTELRNNNNDDDSNGNPDADRFISNYTHTFEVSSRNRSFNVRVPPPPLPPSSRIVVCHLTRSKNNLSRRARIMRVPTTTAASGEQINRQRADCF